MAQAKRRAISPQIAIQPGLQPRQQGVAGQRPQQRRQPRQRVAAQRPQQRPAAIRPGPTQRTTQQTHAARAATGVAARAAPPSRRAATAGPATRATAASNTPAASGSHQRFSPGEFDQAMLQDRLSRTTRGRCGTCASTANPRPSCSGCQLICTLRNTRSGCGIMIVTRPSAAVKPARPPGEPFGLSGKFSVGLPRLSTKRTAAMRLRRAAHLRKTDPALAVRHRHRDARAGHALEEQAGRIEHLQRGQARLVLLRGVAQELRPVLRAGNDVLQLRQHLAAVAHAQRELVSSAKNAANCSRSMSL